MSISPTTPATFYGFNDQLVTMPLVSLAAYVVALRGIVKTGFDVTGQDAESKVREFLETPAGYPLEDILAHLEECKRQTYDYYGIAAEDAA